MAFRPPLDSYSILYHFGLERGATTEDMAEFTLWMTADGGAPGETQLAQIAIGAYSAWQGNMDPEYFTNACYLYRTVARNYNAAGHVIAEGVYAPDPPWIGTADGASLPWSTSLVASLYTYQRGTFVADPRRKRGRIYLPPMAASVLDPSNSGYFENGEMATLIGQVHDFLEEAQQEALGVKVGTLGVFSRMDEEVRDVTNLYMDAKFDVQRRRTNREVAGHLNVPFP